MNYKVDILALTETWLTAVDGDQLVLSACSPGYTACKYPALVPVVEEWQSSTGRPSK